MNTNYQLYLNEKIMLIKTEQQELINLFPQIYESALFMKELCPDHLYGENLQQILIYHQNSSSQLDGLYDKIVQLENLLNNPTGISSLNDDMQEIEQSIQNDILNSADDLLKDLKKGKEKLELFLNIISNIKSAIRATELSYNTE